MLYFHVPNCTIGTAKFLYYSYFSVQDYIMWRTNLIFIFVVKMSYRHFVACNFKLAIEKIKNGGVFATFKITKMSYEAVFSISFI